jgi:hypothetical protein
LWAGLNALSAKFLKYKPRPSIPSPNSRRGR